MGTILVLDGQQRNVISCVRSLANAGHRVVVGAHTPDALCFGSRFTSDRWLYPNPVTSSVSFRDALMNEIESKQYDLVLPFIDATTKIIVESQDDISSFAPVLVPKIKAFQIAFDKALTFQLAEMINIPHPNTLYPISLNEAIKCAREIGFPLVIKPRQSSGSRGLKVIGNEKDLIRYFPIIMTKYPMPLLQEFIPEKESVGFVTIYGKDAKLKAFCQHKRLHQYPLSGGPSTLRETISDDRLKEYGSTLLDELRWVGPAMVEFRVDSRDGVPKLMEINPRLWGSIALHIAAGVNFPELIYKESNDISYPNVYSYDIGKKAKWLLPGEILYFLASLGHGKVELNALKWWGKDLVLDIGSWNDPLPVFYMIKNLIKNLSSLQAIKHGILRE